MKTTEADEFLKAEQLKRLKGQSSSASSSGTRAVQASGTVGSVQYKPSELMRCGFYIAIGFWFASIVPWILYIGVEAIRAAMVTATSAR